MIGRSQRFVSRSRESEYLETNLDVPQDSVLGPLLFSIYINDLQSHLNLEGVRYILYADDLQVYLTVPPDQILEGIARLSFAARKVSEWAAGASLHLNAAKTKAMFFGTEYRVRTLKDINLPGVELGDGVLVPFVDEALSLGVILDSSLTWTLHINRITKKNQ